MGYKDARGIDIAFPAPQFDRLTPLYTMMSTGRKRRKKEGRKGNERSRWKASMYSVLP